MYDLGACTIKLKLFYSLVYSVFLSENKLGGGTCDIAVVSINPLGMYHVLATNGHTRLGGSTFVDRLVNHCIGNEHSLERSDEDLCSIRRACEEGKKKLSTEHETEIIFSEKKVALSREEYNKIIVPYIDKTMLCVTNALEDADLEKNEIDKIILVGGCTYTPLISDTLESFFGKKVNRDINPMEAGKSQARSRDRSQVIFLAFFISLHIKV